MFSGPLGNAVPPWHLGLCPSWAPSKQWHTQKAELSHWVTLKTYEVILACWFSTGEVTSPVCPMEDLEQPGTYQMEGSKEISSLETTVCKYRLNEPGLFKSKKSPSWDTTASFKYNQAVTQRKEIMSMSMMDWTGSNCGEVTDENVIATVTIWKI